MTGVTFTAGSAVFAKTDVGKQIVNIESGGTGKATITGFTSTTVVTGTIDVAFDNLIAILSNNWRLSTEFGGSPNGCGLPVFCDGHQDCILNLGIDGVSPGQCANVFPAGTELDPEVPGLLAGQVLAFSQTMQGPNCEADNQVLAYGSLETNRYCSSGLFADAPGLPVDCTPNEGPPLTGLGFSQSAVPFDVKFSPTTLNISCGTNNNDTWHFTITANQNLTDLTRIVPSSLVVEGVSGQVTCDTVTSTATKRTCHINACQPTPGLPDLGTVVCNTNPKGSADLTVTGLLDSSNPEIGIPIFGEDLGHKTTGQCRPL
jgi:hypothetical protein